MFDLSIRCPIRLDSLLLPHRDGPLDPPRLASLPKARRAIRQ